VCHSIANKLYEWSDVEGSWMMDLRSSDLDALVRGDQTLRDGAGFEE
jgi:hypothetical protein